MGSHGFDEARTDRSHWGRMVESAVGAHLINTADGDTRVHYWRDGDDEVDFVIERRGRLAAIEVKSRAESPRHRGLDEFRRRYPDVRAHLIGGDEMPLGEFLRRPAMEWF
jgi:predicted AAA+ superfamily ATPase